jgi:hypothetical protein
LACLTESPAVGQLITFDTTPGGIVPIDNSLLSTPYALTGGGTVAFFFDRNNNLAFDPGVDERPVFEMTGPDGADAFTNNALLTSDVPAPGFAGQLGSFFLRELQPGSVPDPFIVDYNTSQTITALSGEIWDIDGNATLTERWHVDVLDASNNVLASLDSPLGNTLALDAKPWVLSFSGLPSGVDKLQITFTGTKTSGIGLAFNNFSPTTVVPEPGTWVLMAIGIAALAAARVRTMRRSGPRAGEG